MPTGDPLISVRGLSRSFVAGDETITVLRDVDLDIHAGNGTPEQIRIISREAGKERRSICRLDVIWRQRDRYLPALAGIAHIDLEFSRDPGGWRA